MNFSNMSSSHGLQVFTNCPSVSPFHGVQSMRSRLLQRELLSPQVLPGACSIVGSPRCHSLLWTSTCSGVGSSITAGGSLLHCGPPWAAGGQPASPWSSPQASGESLLWRVEHLLPFLLHCLQSSHSSLLLEKCPYTGFVFLLKYVIQEALLLLLIGLALASSRAVLEPASNGCRTWGKLLAASHRSHPCSPSGYQNLATQTQCNHL